jgi:pimeloyl-ACP methyl ester carboxylesterase
MHGSHTRAVGQRLAPQILAWKEAHPDQKVFLVAHSAGCGVALFAADQLPPNTLERIILLSPAVSARYNLRPALRSSCKGIDVFYSEQDWACLGVGITLFGTTDRHWSAAAGKVGFRPTVGGPGDEELFAKLRQYPWNPTLAVTGNDGGHYGSYQLGFLHAFVVPLLWPDCDKGIGPR